VVIGLASPDKTPLAFYCDRWRLVSEGQRVCPNCGRGIVIHRVVSGELAFHALEDMRRAVELEAEVVRLRRYAEYMAAKNPTSNWDLAMKVHFVEKAQEALGG
jgi:hypothetical protein